MPPKLLISVRSPAECRLARTAGAGVIDIKEPRNGALGFAGIEAIGEIAASLGGCRAPGPPLSVALGELEDWPEARITPGLPDGVTYAKIGLAGCGRRSDWIARWQRLRNRFQTAAAGTVCWIAVCYADGAAEAPSFEQTLAAARETGCGGLMVDTFDKSAGRLFDHQNEETLAAWASLARQAGLLFAAAGSLTADDIPRLERVRPDVAALRGAACAGGRRDGDLDAKAIGHLRALLEQWPSGGRPPLRHG